jgi:hypothetical protein
LKGQKQICKFDTDAYKKTALYNEVVLAEGKEFADKNIPSKYHSEGTAPFCTLENFDCDLVNNGKYPVGSSSNGMGKTCATGKYLMKKVLKKLE